jgi:hypothetical protein
VVPAVSLSQIPDVYDPSIPWQTRHGSLLCPSYFAIKDGEAAARSGDQNWLKQTGCIIAKGGLKIVLVDAPYNPHGSDGVWRGRVYPNDTAAFDAYFNAFYAVSFARGGTFKTDAEAEKTFTMMKQRDQRYFYRANKMEHRLVSVSNSVTLFIGPASFCELELFCNAASEYRETTDEWLKRKQAEHNAFERTLQVSPIKPPTGPRLTCEVPPRQ